MGVRLEHVDINVSVPQLPLPGHMHTVSSQWLQRIQKISWGRIIPYRSAITNMALDCFDWCPVRLIPNDGWIECLIMSAGPHRTVWSAPLSVISGRGWPRGYGGVTADMSKLGPTWRLSHHPPPSSEGVRQLSSLSVNFRGQAGEGGGLRLILETMMWV